MQWFERMRGQATRSGPLRFMGPGDASLVDRFGLIIDTYGSNMERRKKEYLAEKAA